MDRDLPKPQRLANDGRNRGEGSIKVLQQRALQKHKLETTVCSIISM